MRRLIAFASLVALVLLTIAPIADASTTAASWCC